MKNVIIVLAVIIGVIASQSLKPSLDKQIITACDKVNKSAPLMVDNVTRFDNATALSGKIKYLYTLIGLDELSLEQKKAIESNTRDLVKNSSDLKSFREKGIDMGYLYRTESGKEIFEFTIKH